MARFVLNQITLYKNRQSRYTFTMYESDGTTAAAISATDVVRYKIAAADGTIKLDIDSVGATTNGSIVTVTQTSAPATVEVKFAQLDLAEITAGTYIGELSLVDDSQTSPADPIEPIATGPVLVKVSPGGDVALT